jgi:hypothetical protein
MLRVLGWRRRLDNFAAHTARKPNAFAVDVRAGSFQEDERFGKLTKLNTNFFEYSVGIVLDGDQSIFVKYLVIRDLAIYIWGQRQGRSLARRALGLAASPSSSSFWSFAHLAPRDTGRPLTFMLLQACRHASLCQISAACMVKSDIRASRSDTLAVFSTQNATSGRRLGANRTTIAKT